MRSENIIRVVMAVLVLLTINTIFATSSYGMSISEMIDAGKSFLGKGNSVDSTIDVAELQNTSSYIYKLLLTIAIVIAVAVGMIIGIKFMLASADEKANLKEVLIPYVVGCFIIFSAFTIWKIVVNLGENVEGNISSSQSKNTGGGGNTNGGGAGRNKN